MLNYVLGRLLTFIPTFIGVTLISFGFIRALPGDPIQVMAGERGISDERYAQLAKQFGYDQPIYVQFWDYLTGVLQGDLGNSFVTKRPVFDEFFTLFPATLELAVCAMIFAIALGLLFSALHRPCSLVVEHLPVCLFGGLFRELSRDRMAGHKDLLRCK